MFTADAKLACTFAGNAKLRGGRTLECYQYRDATRSFEFREIRFSKRAASNISCSSCHGRDLRPNWESYPIWPGMYGRGDDVIGGSFTHGVDKSEIADYVAFKKSIGTKSRYKILGFDPADVFSPYAGSQEVYAEQKNGVEYRPNLRFSLALQPLLAARGARLLEEKGGAVAARYVVDALCQGYTRYVLKGVFSVAEWTPFFRSLDDSCRDCTIQNAGNRAGNNVGNYEYFSGYRPAFSAVVAENVIRDLRAKGLTRDKAAKLLERANDGAPFCHTVETTLNTIYSR